MRKKRNRFFLHAGVTKTKRPLRKRNAQEEQETQVAVVTWLEAQYPGVLFCASAGGMRTSLRTAVKMKRAGYRKGFPDLFIYEPKRGYNGLAIELKKEEGGRVSDAQKGWIDSLRTRGYYAAVCEGFDEAVSTIEAYFYAAY